MKLLDYEIWTPQYQPLTAWEEHGPFAMWLVQALRPTRIVELGTHYGYSYFAMCQAVQRANLETECFAVDTWTGDEHAGHYSDEVFASVCAENKKYKSFSTLLKKTFEEALSDIADGSVDLLHVDGRHFYEDVKEDFESWLPKLSERSVVLFHDTTVTERGFGVHTYWNEICDKYPSFNFTHCHGLGVLLCGSDVPFEVQKLVSLSRANNGLGVVENLFEAIGGALAERRLMEKTAAAQIESYRQESAAQFECFQKHTAAEIEDIRQNATVEIETITRAAEGTTERLADLLADARRRPLKQLKRLVVRRILLALSKASPPISSRTANRFARSAEKRDPNRSEIAKKISASDYQGILYQWSKQRLAASDKIRSLTQQLSKGPLISIIVPVYNTDPNLLQQMIDSVIGQSFTNWELCIADDASTNSDTKAVLQDAERADSRIKVVYRLENGHISAASNSAIEIAKGEYLALVDHDDVLDTDALLYISNSINEEHDVKIIYSDEDKIYEDGTRFDPHFKPDWNRELLYSYNYVSHLGVYSADLVQKVGGFRLGLEGAQDHDLLLRCLPHITDKQIHHIPKVLYSWRVSPGSTADSPNAKPYAWEAGTTAVSDALTKKAGRPIEVSRGPYPFTYVPQWPIDDEPSVTIVIPTRDRLGITRLAVESIISQTEYTNYSILIVDNGSVEPDTLSWFKEIEQLSNVDIIRDNGPFNYSALNNNAISQTSSDVIALVNNDIEVISKGWLREMVSLAIRPDVGCVGAKLYYPDDRIQHGGVIIGLGGVAGHSHKFADRSSPGYFGRLRLRQEYSAVTGACLVVQRRIFDEVGGLNADDLSVAFNDVDLCLKVKSAGYRNIWTPFAEMYHHESASRKTEDTPEKQARFNRECRYMIETWKTDTANDPHYNPNLNRDFEDFRLGPANWT